SAFYTWLFRITVNVATDRHRQRGAQARAFGPERVTEEEWARTTPDPGGGPDQQAARAEQRERIRQALDALPPKARAIIMLSDVEGLSYREIAEVLNCPIGTVMSRLHNARKRLKGLLGPMLAVILCLGLTIAWASSAHAQQIVRFGVRILEASTPREGQSAPRAAPAPKPDAEADERLRKILPRLHALFRYTDYTTLDRQRVEGPLGAQQRFAVPGERWLEVTPDELHGTSVRMRVRLLRGEQPEMKAAILAAPGAPAVLGGPAYGNGVLIIILWANPNP
ncbi:MAG TPA: sigma-70 family RNA polymerase sigma factor, partial [Methylomirabilota bacterium]